MLNRNRFQPKVMIRPCDKICQTAKNTCAHISDTSDMSRVLMYQMHDSPLRQVSRRQPPAPAAYHGSDRACAPAPTGRPPGRAAPRRRIRGGALRPAARRSGSTGFRFSPFPSTFLPRSIAPSLLPPSIWLSAVLQCVLQCVQFKLRSRSRDYRPTAARRTELRSQSTHGRAWRIEGTDRPSVSTRGQGVLPLSP